MEQTHQHGPNCKHGPQGHEHGHSHGHGHGNGGHGHQRVDVDPNVYF